MTAAQKRAVAKHRERLKERGFVRLEVLAPEADADLIRTLARTLREDSPHATTLRRRLRDATGPERKPNILELIGDDSDVDLDKYLSRRRDLGRDVDL